MRIEVVENYKVMSIRGAEIASNAIRKEKNPTLGLATGNTYLQFYDEIVRMHEEGLDLSEVETFNLDEYVGLDSSHPESFRRYMREKFIKHVNIPERNFHIPNGNADDLEEECKRYEKTIKEAGGIDLQFLGIGANGHIAYNEPGSRFDSRTRVIELDEETRRRKEESLDGRKIPKRAITMGIETIMEADRIVLLATGREKAEAVAKAAEGPITEEVPASVLQRHPDCKFILDEDSASELSSY